MYTKRTKPCKKTKLSQNLRIFNNVIPDNENNLQTLNNIKERLSLLTRDFAELKKMVYSTHKEGMQEKINSISTQIADISILYKNKDNHTEKIIKCIEEFNTKGYDYLLGAARKRLNNL